MEATRILSAKASKASEDVQEQDPLITLICFVDEARAALSATTSLQDHFNQEIDWFRRRREIWTSRTWRIGLIGITSSGKSTLVNALLDDEVLPVRVRPSSNCLVVCRYGPEKLGLAHFENGRVETFEGERIAVELNRLADETTNPHNELGVKEIELRWPRFRFGEDVALVDTPGLDAYGYENHETLTMKLFLPTVDVVVYLTTAKANADGVIANYLDCIGEHRKPLVLVQNMIDSIEPKLGPGGHVERTRQEVARDHLDRLRKLLSDRHSDCIRVAPILQVSATLALQGQLGDSHIIDLVFEVKNHLSAIKPLLSRGRHEQLLQQLEDVISREDSALSCPSVRKAKAEDERKSLAEASRVLAAAWANLKPCLTAMYDDASREGEAFRAEAASLRARDTSGAEDLKSRCEAWLSDLPSKFGEVLETMQRRTEKLAKGLNLRSEDYLFEPPRSPAHQQLRVKPRSREKPVRREQPGFWGPAKRIFGGIIGSDWGYDIRTVTHTELDTADFRKRVEGAVDVQLKWAADASSRVAKNFDRCVTVIDAEIQRQEAGIWQQLASAAKADERREALRQLKNLAKRVRQSRDSLAAEAETQPYERLGVCDQTVIIEIPRYVEALARLVDLRSRQRFYALRESLLSRVGKRGPGADRRVLLWSFDSESLGRFLNRFWSDVLSGPLKMGSVLEWIDDIPPFDAIGVGQEVQDGEKAASVEADVARFFQKPATVFLLLDAGQPGSTWNQLERSEIRRNLDTAAGLVVVVQSIAGLNVAESLIELVRGIEQSGLRPDGFLANDDEMMLSILVDRLAMKGNHLRTHADEIRWLGDFDILDPDQSERYGKILAHWRGMSLNAKGKAHG
jgi:GTPase SAR1 family protein